MKVHRLPPRTHQTAKSQFHKEALSKLDGEDSRANSWKLLHLTFSEYPSFLTANRGNPFTPCFSYLPVSFQFTFVHFLLFFQSLISTMIMFNLLHPLNSYKGIILEQFQVHLEINVSCSHGQNGLRFSIKYNTLPFHLSLQISTILHSPQTSSFHSLEQIDMEKVQRFASATGGKEGLSW